MRLFSKNITLNDTEFYLLISISFLLSFGFRIYLPVFVTWVIVGIVNRSLNLKKSARNIPVIAILFSILYILELTAVRSISDWNIVKNSLETRLALGLIPLLYPWRIFSSKQNITLIYSLILGVITVSIISLTTIVIDCLEIKTWQIEWVPGDIRFPFHYYRSVFGSFMHPSYLTLLITIAFFAILDSRFTLYNKPSKILIVVVALTILTICLFLLQSRAGQISFLIVLILFLLIVVLRRIRILYRLIITATISLTFVAIFLTGPRFRILINKMKQLSEKEYQLTNSEDGTEVRLWIWSVSKDLILEKPIYGYGIVGSQEQLQKNYLRREMDRAYINEYNCHNQFFQSWVEKGIIGLMWLIFLIGYMFIVAMKQKDFLSVGFILAFSFQFLFESMLVRVDGVIIFSLVYMILINRLFPINSNITIEKS